MISTNYLWRHPLLCRSSRPLSNRGPTNVNLCLLFSVLRYPWFQLEFWHDYDFEKKSDRLVCFVCANDAANIAWWRVGKYQNRRHALKKYVLLHILLYKGDKNVQKVPKNAIFCPKKSFFPKKTVIKSGFFIFKMCDIIGVFWGFY